MHIVPIISLVSMTAIELYGTMDRFEERKRQYSRASQRAVDLGRPLVVIGDPDGGAHTRMMRAYGCGDICIDLNGCEQCPQAIEADLTKGPIEEIPDDSSVVFVSCVLEYVDDFDAAWAEILRMAGSVDNVFMVCVQGWTNTALLYPGAKHVLRPVHRNPESGVVGRPEYEAEPVPTAWKVGALAVIGGLLVWGLWPSGKKTEQEGENR